MQDMIREKASGVVPVKGQQDTKVALCINESGNLRNDVKQRILFKPNNSRSSDYALKTTKRNDHYEMEDKNIQCF